MFSGTVAAISPASKFSAVTKSDTAILSYTNADGTILHRARGFMIGGAGDIALVNDAGTAVVFKGLPSGSIISVSSEYVMATDTTATDIVALF